MVMMMVVVMMMMAAAILGDPRIAERLGTGFLRVRGVVGLHERDGIRDRREQFGIGGGLQRLRRSGNRMDCRLRGTQRRQPGNRTEQCGDLLVHMVLQDIVTAAPAYGPETGAAVPQFR